MQINYYTADVFTQQIFGGAQIAVVPEADELDEHLMQKIATEFNLTETVFVKRDEPGRFRLRIFSPFNETEFGSHTTVAAAYVLSSIGEISLSPGQTKTIFAHNTGDVEVHVSEENGSPSLIQISLTTEPIVENFVPSKTDFSEILTLPTDTFEVSHFRPLLVSNQGLYLIVPARGLTQVCNAVFNLKAWNQSEGPSTLVPTPP